MMEGCRRAAVRCCFGYRRFLPLLRVTLATRPRLLGAGNFSSATRRIHHVRGGHDPRGLASECNQSGKKICAVTARLHRNRVARSKSADLAAQPNIGRDGGDRRSRLGQPDTRCMPRNRRIPHSAGTGWRNWKSASRNRPHAQSTCSGTPACTWSRFGVWWDCLSGRKYLGPRRATHLRWPRR